MNKLIAIATLTCLLLAGCANTGKLIATSSTTVDHAMRAWAVYVVDGKANETQEELAKHLQRAYYSSEDVALAALKAKDKEKEKAALSALFNNKSNLINFVTVVTGKAVQ